MTSRHRLSSRPEVREVAVPVTTVWASPAAEEAVTQLLMGEPVRVVEESGGWATVRALWQSSTLDEGGYPGWVRRTDLGTQVPPSGTSACVITSSTELRPDAGSGTELSYGTLLWSDAADDQSVDVLLPDGRRGRLARDAVALSADGRRPHPAPGEVLTAARLFLGVPYLWGGTSAWGVDCSGLVHLAYRRHGVQVPRDAADQATQAAQVPLDAVRPGDLYFFARPGRPIHHVGFVSAPVAADGARTMVHAPESGALVEETTMASDRLDTLVAAGRVDLPDQAG